MEESQTTSHDPDAPEIVARSQSTGDLEGTTPEKSVPPPRPWGQWATIGWTVLCLLAMSGGEAAAIIVMDALGLSRGAGPTAGDAGINGNFLVVSTFFSTLIVVGLVIFLVRARRCSVLDYLALRWPPARSVLLSVAGMVVLLVASDMTSFLFGRPLVPPFVVGLYNTAWLPGLAFAFVVLAPVGEETLFRGFLYKGIAASRAGPIGAIVVSTAAWALLHGQYDWFGIASIAVAGLYLGTVRLLTGSLLLTMLLHGIQNVVGTLEVVIQEYWLK